MTGRDVYSYVRAELAKSGKPPSKLPPDIFMDVLNRSLAELNDKAAIYVARNIQFTISPTTGRYIRVQVGGVMIRVLVIIRASYQPVAVTGAEPIRIEPPFQFVGPEASGATVTTGPPEHVWIEPDNYAPPGTASVSEQVWGFTPMPDQSYAINAACKMVIPDYVLWQNELPAQIRAHTVIGDDVLARLFGMRDFHDNALKSYYYMRAAEGVARLQRGDFRLMPELAAWDMGEGSWRQME